MCLIAFAYRKHPEYPLIFAGNRDEEFGRPTRAARFWDRYPFLLAGKDLEGGGTWLGITKSGRFATVTNFRDPSLPTKEGPSRGDLVLDYLTGTKSAEDYMREVHSKASRYNGFNLLAGGVRDLFYLNNKDGRVQSLDPEVYGLSNHRLNNDWPKVRKARKQLTDMIGEENDSLDPEKLFELLYDERRAPDDKLPDTGLSTEQERRVSPIFIETENYGTRSSTVVMIRRDGNLYFDERYHEPGKKEVERATFELQITDY